MAKNTVIKPVVASVGAAFIAGMATAPVANAAENPFAMTDLEAGYNQLADSHEGKCGEGKCGGEKTKEGKCGEGKCGGEKSGSEGKCGEGKCGGEKTTEGKCGEGKCGGNG